MTSVVTAHGSDDSLYLWVDKKLVNVVGAVLRCIGHEANLVECVGAKLDFEAKRLECRMRW